MHIDHVEKQLDGMVGCEMYDAIDLSADIP